MARVTVEDCLKVVDSRFSLVMLAIKRVKQLRLGRQALVPSRNKEIVVALREIAAGKVTATNVDELGRIEQAPKTEQVAPAEVETA